MLMILILYYASFSQPSTFSSSQETEPSYHMGPVLASNPLNLHIIWYGKWTPTQQNIIRDFVSSLSTRALKSPSVSDWWRTVTLYTDQTNSNVTSTVNLSSESPDPNYSHGHNLTRLSMQDIVKKAFADELDFASGMYLILTSADVAVQDFCHGACGFHHFTFAHVVGGVVPYAWVGNSGARCPDQCAYPFVLPEYLKPSFKSLKPPNDNADVDGMVIVIGHELAEAATNPLNNGWFGGKDTMPNEIADVCLGVYGEGAGGGYPGTVAADRKGRGYNVNGVNGRRFLMQYLWNPRLGKCVLST
ncbi:exordium like 1 [Striga asiatica]|uniref:Exordium like 1 n=1 Tax=Striga asiatica TaxID=4170 RepID=A0A5A7PJZ6_STRAF|nr:exordium like 1 [Striga asiatica]